MTNTKTSEADKEKTAINDFSEAFDGFKKNDAENSQMIDELSTAQQEIADLPRVKIRLCRCHQRDGSPPVLFIGWNKNPVAPLGEYVYHKRIVITFRSPISFRGSVS